MSRQKRIPDHQRVTLQLDPNLCDLIDTIGASIFEKTWYHNKSALYELLIKKGLQNLKKEYFS